MGCLQMSPPQNLGTMVKDEAKVSEEPEVGEDQSEAVSFRHDKSTALGTHSMCVYLQELPCQNTSMRWEGVHEVIHPRPPITEDLRAAGGFQGREHLFSKGVALGKSTTLQGVVTHPEVYGWHKFECMGYYF